MTLRSTQMMNLEKQGEETELRADSDLTGSYENSSSLDAALHASVELIGVWTFGDETSVEIEVQFSSDGSTWRRDTVAGAPSSGVAAVRPHSLQFTKANFTDGDRFRIGVYDAGSVLYIRARVKKTGGSSPGSFAILAIGGAL